MAAHAHTADPADPLHRAAAATWRAIRVAAAAVARFTVAVVRWCRGAHVERRPKIARAERKRLRKEKMREALGRKQPV